MMAQRSHAARGDLGALLQEPILASRGAHFRALAGAGDRNECRVGDGIGRRVGDGIERRVGDGNECRVGDGNECRVGDGIGRRARWARLFSATALTILSMPSCRANDGPQVGSESHFLEHCSDACGNQLSCVCGTCTQTCTSTDQCRALQANAECVSAVNRAGADDAATCTSAASCDVPCAANGECSVLGTGYLCRSGFCRSETSHCSSTTLPAGDYQRQIMVGDTERSYVLHVPPGYTGAQPVPLVLDFHPMSMLGALQWEKDNSGYQALSDQKGFLVAWPQGIETAWNLGPCCTSSKGVDDFAFARAIVQEISGQTCVDPRRVHAVGFSIGGAMAYYLGCFASDVFASVAASSMDLFVDSEISCHPDRPVAEISFRDTQDTVVPYGGGTSSPPGHPEMSATLLGAVGTFQRWAQIDGCDGAPSAPDDSGCSSYAACRNGVEVTLCTSPGTGLDVGDVAIREASASWSMFMRQPMP